MSAIQAELIGYKTLQTKKTLQLILEVPLEHAQQVTSSLGWPYPGESLYVAVTHLNLNGYENAGNKPKNINEQVPVT